VHQNFDEIIVFTPV